MEKRLLLFLQSEDMNPTRLADKIGVQRSSISHILSGRNKPSYDFLLKILDSFPQLNAEWLLTGKGKMYKSEIPGQRTLFDQVSPDTRDKTTVSKDDTTTKQIIRQEPIQEKKSDIQEDVEIIEKAVYKSKQETKDIKIEKIVILYSNGTFKEYISAENDL
jgi:transcriptional regulator with XRE-family HTH domain